MQFSDRVVRTSHSNCFCGEVFRIFILHGVKITLALDTVVVVAFVIVSFILQFNVELWVNIIETTTGYAFFCFCLFSVDLF